MSVIEEIAAERRRQIEVEGWTPEHDDEHDDGSLAAAAAAYAYATTLPSRERGRLAGATRAEWPGFIKLLWPAGWDGGWFKPKGSRRDLIRAAALLVAEVERLDRATIDTPAGPASTDASSS